MRADGAGEHARGHFAWHLGAGTDSISRARQAFDAWFRQSTSDPELLQDMSVVVSELASNAVEGGDPKRPNAQVQAEVVDDVLEIVVSNRMPPAVAGVRRWDLDDTLRGGGRGLLIVRAYTDSLAVDSIDHTVRVRCTRRLQPSA